MFAIGPHCCRVPLSVVGCFSVVLVCQKRSCVASSSCLGNSDGQPSPTNTHLAFGMSEYNPQVSGLP